MKTAKEYIERIRSDKDFVSQMREKVRTAQDAGDKDVFAAISKAAKELGYDVSPEQIAEISRQNEDVSEEELGKIAGGTSCSPVISTMSAVSIASVSVTISVSTTEG